MLSNALRVKVPASVSLRRHIINMHSELVNKRLEFLRRILVKINSKLLNLQ